MRPFKYLMILFITSILLVGCNNKEEEKNKTPDVTIETQLDKTIETQPDITIETQLDDTKETEKESPKDTLEEITKKPETETIKETQKEVSEFQWLYDELEGKRFTLSSGAGAWSTDIKFEKNGKFEGYYHDTNMGDPKGPTKYEHHFSGKMNITEKNKSYIYSMKLEDYENLNEKYKNLDKEAKDKAGKKVDEEVRIEYVDKLYGFEDSKDFTLFLPSSDLSKESEKFKGWISIDIKDESKNDRFVIKNNVKEYGIVEVIQ